MNALRNLLYGSLAVAVTACASQPGERPPTAPEIDALLSGATQQFDRQSCPRPYVAMCRDRDVLGSNAQCSCQHPEDLQMFISPW